MTPILDLMHALSYAYRAARDLERPELYPHWAKWIWEGKVSDAIDGLRAEGEQEDAPESVAQAVTDYENHQELMKSPEYRTQGLPTFSSVMESTIKQINQRVKGREKFWKQECGEGMLQLRADFLSDSTEWEWFRDNWTKRQTGSNRYQNAA